MKNASKTSRRTFAKAALAGLIAGAGVLAAAPAAAADAFPQRAVTIVVPFPPGGATDLTARLVGDGLSRKWGQPVVIENRPGAGGNVGSEYVAKAAPDGYTLVLGVTGSHGINVSLYNNMRYHPLEDFEPLTQATLYPNAIVANKDVPANDLRELIALLQGKDGRMYSYGSDGNGTASHLGMELLKHQGGFEIAHIPYRGSTPMVTDLLGGQIQVGVTGLPAVQSYLKDGQLKLLALTTGERFAGAPDLPTVAEQGFEGFDAPPWSGFFAPKGTPAPVVEKLSADMREIMADPALREKIAAAGSEFTPSTPAEFRSFVEGEIAKWKEAVELSGASVD